MTPAISYTMHTSMSNLHRIQWIDAQLREGRYPNCTSIAKQFEISVRQASRDVDYLKYSLGAPVEYSFGQRGFFYTESTFALPALFLGEEDRETLHYLADRYRSAGGETADRLAALFEKLDPLGTGKKAEPSPAVPVYTLKSAQVKTYGQLKEATARRNKVRITYVDTGNRRSERVIHPYLVFIREKADYVHAFCESRAAERDFRIDRIDRLTVLEERFTVPGTFDPRTYEKGFRFNFRLPYRTLVRFDVPPPAPCPLPLIPAGDNTYGIEFAESRELLGALLSLSTPFSIISPLWLRRKCFDLLTRLRDNNSIT